MKLALISTLLLCAVAAVFSLPKNQEDPSKPRKLTTRSTSRAESPHAHDAEPPPLNPITPASLGISAPLNRVNPAALIAQAIAENDLPAIQTATLAWFEQDPAAARDWLAMQPTYDDLQPAISFIANRISETGNHKTALEWSELLPGGTLRDDTVFNIYALAIRNGKITAAEINPDGIPPERYAELLSGAAGD